MAKTRADIHRQVRARHKSDAAKNGMSLKQYRASKSDSVGWNYAIEIIKKRCTKNGIECSINAKDLRSLWSKQLGTCPLTGWIMLKRKTGAGLCKNTVTVDRINPSIGYTKNNVRLVAFAANNAKYVWSDE